MQKPSVWFHRWGQDNSNTRGATSRTTSSYHPESGYHLVGIITTSPRLWQSVRGSADQQTFSDRVNQISLTEKEERGKRGYKTKSLTQHDETPTHKLLPATGGKVQKEGERLIRNTSYTAYICQLYQGARCGWNAAIIFSLLLVCSFLDYIYT